MKKSENPKEDALIGIALLAIVLFVVTLIALNDAESRIKILRAEKITACECDITTEDLRDVWRTAEASYNASLQECLKKSNEYKECPPCDKQCLGREYEN